MTNQFGSSDDAIKVGLSITGHTDEPLTENNELRISQFGNPLETVKAVEYTRKDGMKIAIVSTKFRDGFDCWIVGPSGFAQRV